MPGTVSPTVGTLFCPSHGNVDLTGVAWACPRCGATLRPLPAAGKVKVLKPAQDRARNIYRYHELMPAGPDPVVGLYTGWTPLAAAPRLGAALGIGRLYLKLDCYNWPTYSYKDRVVSSGLQRAREMGSEFVACVSTGNVGNSVAALAAIAGMKAIIFYPAGIEPGKNVMTLAHGASIIQIDGTFDEANAICRELALEGSIPFVNLTLRPYYAEGAKTIAYEIVEQLGGVQPDHVVAPAAGAALLTRMAFGFDEAAELGMAEGATPRIHAAQAAGCSPIARAFRSGSDSVEPQIPQTYARSIAIGNPTDGPMALRVIRKSGGTASAASDAEIRQAVELLATTEGVFAEPAGGAAVAVAGQLAAAGIIKPGDVTVVAITGSGLKVQDGIRDMNTQIIRAGVDVEKVRAVLAEIL